MPSTHPSLALAPSFNDEGDKWEVGSTEMEKESDGQGRTYHNVGGAVPVATGDANVVVHPCSHTTSCPSAPSTRKRKLSAQGQDVAQHSGPSKRSSNAMTSMSQLSGWLLRSETKGTTQATTSTKFSTEVTSAIAISGMQGSINRFTDVLERSIQVTSTASTTIPMVPKDVPVVTASAHR